MRNPRRAYDKDGREIPPMTVANVRSLGCKTVEAFCEAMGCGHSAVVELDPLGLPGDFPAPDIALRLRCSRCGSKRVVTRLNMKEYYEARHIASGFSYPMFKLPEE